MRKLLLSGVAVLALSSVAMAADPIVFVDEVVAPPPAPITTWDGFFVGVLGGYGWAQDGLDVDSYSYHDLAVRTLDVSTGASALERSFDFLSDEDASWASDSGDGWWGGGVVGYNFQSGKFVFGVEGDVSFSDINVGSQSTSSRADIEYTLDDTLSSGGGGTCSVIQCKVPLPNPPVNSEAQSSQVVQQPVTPRVFRGSTESATYASADVDWYGTARVKAGYAMDNILLYGTGGLAFGQVKLDGRVDTVHSFVDGSKPVQSSSFDDTSTELGWTLGGGVDVAVSPNFIVGAFYRYVDLGSVSGGAFQGKEKNFGEGRTTASEYGEGNGYARADANFHTVGVRAVYKFNSGGLFN